MKKYQITLHNFSETNRYEEKILGKCVLNLTSTLQTIHENHDFPILLLPNNVEAHLNWLEALVSHITIELLQEID